MAPWHYQFESDRRRRLALRVSTQIRLPVFSFISSLLLVVTMYFCLFPGCMFSADNKSALSTHARYCRGGSSLAGLGCGGGATGSGVGDGGGGGGGGGGGSVDEEGHSDFGGEGPGASTFQWTVLRTFRRMWRCLSDRTTPATWTVSRFGPPTALRL